MHMHAFLLNMYCIESIDYIMNKYNNTIPILLEAPVEYACLAHLEAEYMVLLESKR